MLLKAGASPSEADAEGNTPLHLAVRWGDTNCPSLLIHAHAPLDVTNRAGKTALRVAVESGASANVELLLKAGARTEVGLGSNTLLHVAAAQSLPKYSNMGPEFQAGERSAQSIPVLLGHGMRVDARDGGGSTPLQQAVTALNWKAMNLLLRKGADVNAVDARGNSALHQIVTQSWEYAVCNQWPPSLAQSNRVTALVGQHFEASNSTNISVTSWLLEHGANPNLANQEGRTPLELICRNSWRHYEMSVATNRIALLLKAGAKVPALDSKGQALLRQVVGEERIPAIGR